MLPEVPSVAATEFLDKKGAGSLVTNATLFGFKNSGMPSSSGELNKYKGVADEADTTNL